MFLYKIYIEKMAPSSRIAEKNQGKETSSLFGERKEVQFNAVLFLEVFFMKKLMKEEFYYLRRREFNNIKTINSTPILYI